MNIDDLKNDLEEMENDEDEDQNLVGCLYGLIEYVRQSELGLISEKNFEKECTNFRNDFPDYPFPNCIYFKGQPDES